MPVDLSSLLADTLSARGYDVEDAPPLDGASGASYPVSLLAHRDGQRFLVDVLASRTVRDEDVQAIASIVDDAGLDGAIVIALDGADHTPEAPGADRVDVWSPQEAQEAVGAHVLSMHRSAGTDPDDIGPSPVEPYDVATDDQEAEPMGAPNPNRETGEPREQPQGSAQSTSADPEPAASPDRSAPRAEAHTGPDPNPDPDPRPSAGQPDTTPDPQPDPEPQTAAADASQPAPEPDTETEATPDEPEADDGGADPADPTEDVDHRELVDPEDMLERAEQLMEQGAVDDGDAELLVEEDDEPEADPERSQRAHSQRSEQTDPGGAGEPQPAEQSQQPRQSHQPQQADPAAEPTQPRGAEKDPMPAEDGSDAEILDPEPSTSRPEPDAEPPEPEPASTARGSPSESTPDPETTDPSTSSPPDAVDSPAAAAGARSEDPSFVSGTTIEPQVDRDEALREAEEALFEADDARLELLPFRVYRYQARLVGDGAEREDEGRVWVSTQSGAVVRAPAGDRVAELDQPHERFDGSMSGDETQAAAREHLLDSLERRDERRQDYNESAVIERVQLEPDPEALAVDRLGKAYAPRWRVEGPDGTVFVDAVTGEVVTD